jgi:tight adherence protein B
MLLAFGAMGALLGLSAAVGVLLVWRGSERSVGSRSMSRLPIGERVEEMLTQAGYRSIPPGQLYAASGSCAVVAFVVVAGTSRTATIALAFAGFAAYAPIGWVRRRRIQRSAELRAIWPDVVDNLASAVRAGVSLPEAVGQLAVRGPEPLRPGFASFTADYRSSGRFGECLDRLKDALADPVADRIVESLRIARDVGGSDLGRLLRTLSQFLRDDARTRAELEARQGWTVGAARLALAAPWIVLAMLALRPETVVAYDSAAGVVVLVVGAAASFGAYRVMLRVAQLPGDPRVLR